MSAPIRWGIAGHDTRKEAAGGEARGLAAGLVDQPRCPCPPRWNRRERFNESVIGTAFWRFGEVGHDDCIEFRAIGLDALDNQIDTLSKAFQATTVACARCHDHKLDAVSTRDYYALLGVLRSSRQVAHTIDAPEVNADTIARLTELKAAIGTELAAA